MHPRLAENQVSGGVLQFLGIALREELYLDKHRGVTLNANFLEHKSTSIVVFADRGALSLRRDPVGPMALRPSASHSGAGAGSGGQRRRQRHRGVDARCPVYPQRVLQAIHEQGKGVR